MIQNLALSGELMSGKDYVADFCGFTKIGFADPLYKMAEHFFGTSDKAKPGIRRFLQEAGQIGWGIETEEYPYTIERALFVTLMRQQGRAIVPQYDIDWSHYGQKRTFWADVLVQRVHSARLRELTLPSHVPAARFAVVNIRFEHEYQPVVIEAGFEHYHVRCSEETRQERMRVQKYQPKAKDLNDESEKLAKRLNEEMPDHRVIWNDHRPVPSGKEYLSLAAFADFANGTQKMQAA